MKLGIVGSRRRNLPKDKELIRQKIIELKPDSLVSGGCRRGADRFAEELAIELHLPIEIFRPNLKGNPTPTRYDMIKAFYARNRQVAAASNYLIALVAPDRKGGTEHTIGVFNRLHRWDCEIL